VKEKSRVELMSVIKHTACRDNFLARTGNKDMIVQPNSITSVHCRIHAGPIISETSVLFEAKESLTESESELIVPHSVVTWITHCYLNL
jgi:hypothetical protein